MLARLRFDVSRTAGRRYPEFPHPYRNDFQRDRDRVIHSRAFRRLENKTQVFPRGFSDHFRNRLTHTIEVAQIARTVAATLGLNEDLTEALALVHDIGHPPFAHAGEAELDVQMRRFCERFDHNVHALRIVEHFEHRYARFPGLNLTFEVREGILKHSHDFEAGESAELDEFLPGLRPPLEAQLIDLCDEVAYNTADLDDAFSAELVDVARLCAEVPRFAELYEAAEMQYPGAPERVRIDEIVRGLVDWLVSGIIRGTVAAAGGVDSAEEVRRHPGRIACYSAEAAETTTSLKRVLRESVYESAVVQAARRESTLKIAMVFEYLLAHPDAMPAEFLESRREQPPHRTVCDYIAGMTDGYLERTWAQFTGQ